MVTSESVILDLDTVPGFPSSGESASELVTEQNQAKVSIFFDLPDGAQSTLTLQFFFPFFVSRSIFPGPAVFPAQSNKLAIERLIYFANSDLDREWKSYLHNKHQKLSANHYQLILPASGVRYDVVAVSVTVE